MTVCYRYEATVKGSGTFPIDMLRYDGCHPLTEQDSAKIGSGHWRDAEREPREVTVSAVAYSHNSPFTVNRWRSFGWPIMNVRDCGKV